MPELISPFGDGATKPGRRSQSVIWKMLMIIGLILILLIPLNMVSGVIAERQFTRQQVIAEIAQTWAGQQTVTGPVLAVPYKHTVETQNEEGKRLFRTTQRLAYLLPGHYDVQTNIKPEIRYRGIYQSIVYTSDLAVQGSFNPQTIQELNIAKENILWDKAFLVVGIPSTKGINRKPTLSWQGKAGELKAGTNEIFIGAGLHMSAPVNPSQLKIPFKLSLSLKGSEAISIVPIGKESTIQIQSTWPSPSFIGSMPPSARKVSNEGFKATWDIPYFARSYGQTFTSESGPVNQLKESSVGVELLTPVDSYRQSDRAIKYGVLFLVLSFATYFLFEIISRYRLHAFQYLLVGCAISLFYLLLVALSEVIHFDAAYGVASLATISAITLYSRAVLGKIRRFAELMIGGLLVILYGYLYILLQLEERSLLFGAIGLFIVLATIMYVTRNIDWYNEQTA